MLRPLIFKLFSAMILIFAASAPQRNKLLKEKRGLGDCPQGFDFVFELKQKGFHVLLLTLLLN